MFDELGIPVSTEDSKDIKLIEFLRQSRERTLAGLLEEGEVANHSHLSCFNLLGQFNEDNLIKFLGHELTSKIVFFVFGNYLEDYTPLITPKYQGKLRRIIGCLLTLYKNMRSPSDLKTISLWIRSGHLDKVPYY